MYYGWILLASIGTIYMITTGAVFYGLSVMMPAMIEDLGWTRAQATTGFAILSLVIGFAGPVVTMAMKKLSPRITIILGGFVSAIGALILYNYHSLTVYYAAAVLLACGVGSVPVAGCGDDWHRGCLAGRSLLDRECASWPVFAGDRHLGAA